MKNIDQRNSSIISAIELDLMAARHERRFEDMLDCLDEILVHYKHSESDVVKSRCAALLAAPELIAPTA